MKYEYVKKLTWDIVNKYGDRKKSGLLCLFYDTRNKKFIPIPRNKEHIITATEILGCDIKDIETGEVDISVLVPVTIFINPETNKIEEVIIGPSGISMRFGIKYPKTYFQEAIVATSTLLNNSEIPIEEGKAGKVSIKAVWGLTK